MSPILTSPPSSPSIEVLIACPSTGSAVTAKPAARQAATKPRRSTRTSGTRLLRWSLCKSLLESSMVSSLSRMGRKDAFGTSGSRLVLYIGSQILYFSCYSVNARPDDGQRLADAFALDALDLESRRGDGRLGAPREMAVAHQVLPDGFDAPLPFEPRRSPVGGDVLEKHQASARLQYAGDLGERRALVRHRAQDERTDHRIELSSLERQRVERRVGYFDIAQRRIGLLLQLALHVCVRLAQHEPRDRPWIVRQRDAGSGADLEHRSGEITQQLGAPLREAGFLASAHAAVIDRGHQPGH